MTTILGLSAFKDTSQEPSSFLGYCQQEGKSILVYEFMHNGTLKEHLHGTLTQERHIGWIKRLEIAEDAAKGIEYLHTGCFPAVIHRDLKTSNILLDKDMRAKVQILVSQNLQ
ncbi:probable LRR receptor-like serine/threonine-protein kinase At1g67720 [Elaeis guineensis]|uniref:probable LRR receptor-like serine/threonine-protein kinase At1g67720 n=1 Tax=Elaeis guineensis var. tenera TaxID=51953 RepID=UPI003C6DA96A